MDNLKITINLLLPFIADRLTTIDSILVGEFFKLMKEKNKFREFTDDLSMIDFIDRKHGVLSGSIWYVPKDAPLKLDFVNYYKKPETKKIFDITKLHARKPISNDFAAGQLKAFAMNEEIILTPSVYFYIRGKRGQIEQLLRRLKHFGKKGAIGFGAIESVEVEIIKEDYSFSLNKTTPSKPLPVKDFDIQSKKIAYYRSKPPYWEVRDIEACYMPTTSLCEYIDDSYKNSKFKVSSHERYISGLSYLAEVMDGKKGLPKISDLKIEEDKRRRWNLLEDNNKLACCATGEVHSSGITDVDNYINVKMVSFTSQALLVGREFLSKEAIWSFKMPVIRLTGDSILTKDGLAKVTESGAEEGARFKDLIKEPDKLKPPFVIMRKESSSKPEHLALRSRVAVSNAFYPLQYGEKTYYIDSQLLIDAVNEIREITSDKKLPTKSHLLGMWRNGNKHPRNKKELATKEYMKIIENFHKKYDKSIRMCLFSVTDFS